MDVKELAAFREKATIIISNQNIQIDAADQELNTAFNTASSERIVNCKDRFDEVVEESIENVDSLLADLDTFGKSDEVSALFTEINNECAKWLRKKRLVDRNYKKHQHEVYAASASHHSSPHSPSKSSVSSKSRLDAERAKLEAEQKAREATLRRLALGKQAEVALAEARARSRAQAQLAEAKLQEELEKSRIEAESRKLSLFTSSRISSVSEHRSVASHQNSPRFMKQDIEETSSPPAVTAYEQVFTLGLPSSRSTVSVGQATAITTRSEEPRAGVNVNFNSLPNISNDRYRPAVTSYGVTYSLVPPYSSSSAPPLNSQFSYGPVTLPSTRLTRLSEQPYYQAPTNIGHFQPIPPRHYNPGFPTGIDATGNRCP